MNKECREPSWRVYREIDETGAIFLGVVDAPDEERALKLAIERFNITGPQVPKAACGGEARVSSGQLR
jgi:hypothetical protein